MFNRVKLGAKAPTFTSSIYIYIYIRIHFGSSDHNHCVDAAACPQTHQVRLFMLTGAGVKPAAWSTRHVSRIHTHLERLLMLTGEGTTKLATTGFPMHTCEHKKKSVV